MAIGEGIKLVKERDYYINAKIVLLTDAKEVLDSINNPNVAGLDHIISEIIRLMQRAHEVWLQWINC